MELVSASVSVIDKLIIKLVEMPACPLQYVSGEKMSVCIGLLSEFVAALRSVSNT